MDLGYYMVASAFGAAVLAFLVGLAVTRGRGEPQKPPLLPGMPEPGPFSAFWRVPSYPFQWFDLIAAAFVIGIYMLPLLLEPLGAMPEGEMEITYEVLVGTVITQGFFTVLVIGVMVWRVNPVHWLGLFSKRWWMAFLLAPVAVFSTWIFAAGLEASGVNAWIQAGIDGDGTQELVSAFQVEEDGILVALMCFTAGIVAPITEEIIFRGYVYPASKRFVGRVPAILFSALIFAAIHHNAMALLPLFFLAVLLTLAYEFTGTIWAPIAGHFLFNAATLTFQMLARLGLIEIPS